MKIIIQTTRFYLRESTVEDANLAFELNLDPEVIRYTGDPPFSDVKDARRFLENYDAFSKYGMGRWYAFLKDTDEFVGWCGLKYDPDKREVDVGYRLLKKYWGFGYASELATAAIHYGFTDLGLDRIVARSDIRNKGSIRVMEKIGMEFLAHIDFDGTKGVVYVAEKEKWKL